MEERQMPVAPMFEVVPPARITNKGNAAPHKDDMVPDSVQSSSEDQERYKRTMETSRHRGDPDTGGLNPKRRGIRVYNRTPEHFDEDDFDGLDDPNEQDSEAFQSFSSKGGRHVEQQQPRHSSRGPVSNMMPSSQPPNDNEDTEMEPRSPTVVRRKVYRVGQPVPPEHDLVKTPEDQDRIGSRRYMQNDSDSARYSAMRSPSSDDAYRGDMRDVDDAPGNGFQNPEMTDDEDDDSGLFVPEGNNKPRRRLPANRVQKSSQSSKSDKGLRLSQRFGQDDYARAGNTSGGRQRSANADRNDRSGARLNEKFNDRSKSLAPSRYSGGVLPWGINAQPPQLPQEQVSNASLMKRRLTRGSGSTVSKRGYGANDPENIEIVNLKDHDGLNFDQIAKKLNAERVDRGQDPTLSQTGCNARYNRTAPILYAARGEEFVPLSQRKDGTGHGKRGGIVWDDELDESLITVVNEWNSNKWHSVAEVFNERNGLDVSATCVAKRKFFLCAVLNNILTLLPRLQFTLSFRDLELQ